MYAPNRAGRRDSGCLEGDALLRGVIQEQLENKSAPCEPDTPPGGRRGRTSGDRNPEGMDDVILHLLEPEIEGVRRGRAAG